MLRKIIEIDEARCNGCQACANACHEGAIMMINGKAKLIRDDYCDGLGDCLPSCPTNAIKIVEKDVVPYDEQAVRQHLQHLNPYNDHFADQEKVSMLAQWPCQLKLVPAKASFLANSRLLIAADCCAYAYAKIHEDFMKGKITLIGCPKLDMVDYGQKLTDIFKNNEIKDITVLKMVVPCCAGIELAVKRALRNSHKSLPCQVVTISKDGKIIERS